MGSSSNAASEVEDLNSSKAIESQSKVDHNYSGNREKNAKKISEDVRNNRPSTDSLPECQDLIAVKEILDSIVGVVAERFIDEAKEKATSSKFIVESVAEESVYTSKNSTEASPKTVETEQINQIISPVQEPMAIDEIDEFAKLQELARELEKAAAYNKSVENQDNLASGSKKNSESLTQTTVKDPEPMQIKEELSETVNKDEEVLMSLTSILSSLEAVKKSENQTIEKENNEMEVEVNTDITVKDHNKNSMCIQSMEISTSETANKAEPSSIQDGLEEQENKELVNETEKQESENNEILSEARADLMDISTVEQNDSDKSVISDGKGNLFNKTFQICS